MLVSMVSVSVNNVAAQAVEVPFTVLALDTPEQSDPVMAYDSSSINILDQTVEGLYRYNLSSPQMEPIPCLAESLGTWSGDGLELTINLRDDAYFHNGVLMNATHVQWNFDRIFDFSVNWTGMVTEYSLPQVLYQNDVFDYNDTWSLVDENEDPLNFTINEPVVAQTLIMSEFQIKFVLNKPWAVWEQLLAFSGSSIIFPDATLRYAASSATQYAKIIGTGPFKVQSIVPDEKTTLISNPDYYLGEANIKKIIYLAIADGDVASAAVLNHEVHYGGVSPDYLVQARADPLLTIEAVKTTVVFYAQFNQPKIPYDLRKAMAFAYNHDYYIYDVEGGNNFPLHTPIPDGMTYHNASIEGLPYFNVTHARLTIMNSVDAAVSVPFAAAKVAYDAAHPDDPALDWNNETQWNDEYVWNWIAAISPVANYGFYRYVSSGVDRVYTVLADNFRDIGIRLRNEVIGDWGLWSEWVTKPANKQTMDISMGGWGPDYNDPINMMEPIFKSGAAYNDMLIAEPLLDAKMSEYYNVQGAEQEAVAWELQEMIAVTYMPCFYLYQRGARITYNNEVLSNIDDMKNVFSNHYWYNVIYTPKTIGTVDDDDTDGDVTGGFIPGFSPMFLIAAAGVTAILLIRKRK